MAFTHNPSHSAYEHATPDGDAYLQITYGRPASTATISVLRSIMNDGSSFFKVLPTNVNLIASVTVKEEEEYEALRTTIMVLHDNKQKVPAAGELELDELLDILKAVEMYGMGGSELLKTFVDVHLKEAKKWESDAEYQAAVARAKKAFTVGGGADVKVEDGNTA